MGNFPHTHTQINVAQTELYSFSPSERKNYHEGLLLHMLASCAFKIDKQKQSPRRRHRMTSDGCRGLLNITVPVCLESKASYMQSVGQTSGVFKIIRFKLKSVILF